MSIKKGLGMFQFGGRKAAEVGASWYYNWTPRERDSGRIEFVPMIWGERDSKNENYQLAKDAASPYLLGFNEPDSRTGGDEAQAMSPEHAANIWPRLEWTGKRLGSPAVASNLDWQARFMKAAGGDNVDFMAVHHYPDISDPHKAALEVHALCGDFHVKYGKQIWLTEFGALGHEPSIQVIQFIHALVPMLEAAPFIDRYAWFADFGYRGYDGSAIFDRNGNLTPVGVAYRDAK